MKHKTVLDAVYPVLALGLLGTVLGYLSYRHEEQLRQSIHGNFSRFVAPTLVERMVRGGIAVALGGERKELSVLFVDMRGYTRLSETMDAQDLIQFTNRYLQPTSDAVQRDHGGTIDKYIGDSVMAFWNAPLDDPDHPRHACLAILAIRRGIAELNRQLTAEGLPYAPIRIGIGVSTGECSVGNVGSRQKLEYTALGDTVNLASRLEGLTKEFGVDNLVDTATIQRAGDLAYLPLGELDIRGRGRAVSAATLVGDERTAGDPAFLAFAAKHHAWMNAHHNNDSEAATRLFAELKQEAANFGVERVYAAISSRSPG
jgi:adenylate cyclase